MQLNNTNKINKNAKKGEPINSIEGVIIIKIAVGEFNSTYKMVKVATVTLIDVLFDFDALLLSNFLLFFTVS